MKSSALLSLAVATLALAKPHRRGHRHAHPKRANPVTEWVTVYETEIATLYIDATTTTLILPTKPAVAAKPPTTTPESKPEAASGGQFRETPVVEAPPPPPTTTTTSSPPPPPPPPPPPSTSEVAKAAPSPAPAPAVAPSPNVGNSNSGNSGSGSSSSKPATGVRHGDMTHYTVGLGSCGKTRTEAEGKSVGIVALSHKLMTAVSTNNDPMCGKTITISANGKSTTAIVEDKCPSCAEDAIDLSEYAFLQLAGDLGVGRTQVDWWFN